jgi:hypothetical protein
MILAAVMLNFAGWFIFLACAMALWNHCSQ